MKTFSMSSILSRLKFTPDLEREFQTDYDDRFYAVNRTALVVGLFVTALFGFLDFYSTSEPAVLRTILAIRYLVICPVFIFGIIWSFLPALRAHMQSVTSAVSGIGGLGMAIMVGLSNHKTAAFNSYYVGMIVVTLALYTFTRVRFRYAITVSLVIMLSYEIAAVFFQNLLSASMGTSAFITANFFFVTANFVGAFASYNLEFYTRQDFIQRRTIEDEKARSESMLQREAAEALKASEARFRTVVEISTEGIIIIDQDGAYQYVSPALERIMGYSAAELIGQSVFQSIYLDDLASAQSEFANLIQYPDYLAVVELRIIRKDGVIRILESTAKRLPGGDIVAFSHDITERKQAEADLLRQNSYLSTLHDTTLDLINRLETPGLLKTIVARAANLLDAQEAYIFLVAPDESSLVAETGVGSIFTQRGRFHVQRGEGVGGRVWESGKLLAIENYETWEHRMAVSEFDAFRSVVGAPLTSGERTIGVLTLARTTMDEPFQSDQLDFLSQFAHLVSIALDNSRLYTAAQTELTERRRTEEKLRESEEYYRSLIENSSDGIVIFDRQGTFQYVSPGLTRIVGWDTSELLGKTWHSLAHPDDLNRTRSIFHEIFDNPGQVMVHESRFQHKDGSWRVMEIVGKLHPSGRVVTNNRDITDRKKAEEELRRLNEELERRVEERTAEVKRLAVIIEAMPDYVGIADLQGNSLYVNRAGRRLVGKPEESDGSPWNVAQCYPPDYTEQLQPMFNAMQKGESWAGELDLRHLDGYRIPADHVIFPLHNASGEIESYAAVIRNITERKQAEEELRNAKEVAEAANKAKSTFLANMSHEIRTPMNAVIGMTSLLLETPLNIKQRDFVETIRSSGDILLTIINDILDFSKIEAGKMELVNRPLDLRNCIESTLDLMAPRIAEKNLNVAYFMETNVPAAILGDSTRLRQILVNLVGNAVKFTENGEIIIRVDAKRLTEAQNGNRAKYEVYFTVRDTGIGIPPDKQDRLFTSFSQVDPSSTRVYGGTGLGLAISKRLAELMGGAMWVESTGIPGEGTIFHYTIRADEAELPAQKISRSSVAELTGRKILLVDDHETNLQILQLQTEAWGMMAYATTSSEQALTWLKQGQSFDIAILDSQMPGMNGVELAKAIRKCEAGPGSGAKRLHLILLTSVLQSESDSAGLFEAILTKPVKSSSLFDVLMTVFDQNRTSEHHSAKSEALAQFDGVERLADQYPLRILLVEDVQVNQKFALLALERVGYRADVAGNGQEAMAALLRQPYDVVLMDINMPVMDGYEASRQIHELWKNGGRPFNVPRPWIVAMTANALQGDRELAFEAGADDYISKPVYLNELQRVLMRAGHERRNPIGGSMTTINEATMNQDHLQNLLDLPDGKSLVAAFLEEAPTILKQIQVAVADTDAQGLKHAAHALKGSSLYVGAMDVADLAKELEIAGRTNELGNVEATFAKLQKSYLTTSTILAKYV